MSPYSSLKSTQSRDENLEGEGAIPITSIENYLVYRYKKRVKGG